MNTKKFAEVTGMAVLMFALPVAYYYGRPHILSMQDRAYDKFFKLDQSQYEAIKEKQKK